ncbi:MAG: phosphodiesterase [Curvibacter sp. PD_MW3]|nr:MAG: phosphodiesterase [Curvibacter sp. PD_MW3]
MAQLELSPEKLFLGMSLNFTLRDEKGVIMLAKGQRIETAQQLEAIRSRRKLFVEIEESEVRVRAMMAGISALSRADAPIKDMSQYVDLYKPRNESDKLTGTLAERWGDVESKLNALLSNVAGGDDFERKVHGLAQHIHDLMSENAAASHFLLFNRAVTEFGGYSALHALLCAALGHSLGDSLSLTDAERRSLVCGALTMNVAMSRLQDTLAVQKYPPMPHQRMAIDSHAEQGQQMLLQAGVSDQDWLTIVGLHHTPLQGPEQLSDWAPALRLTKVLQTLDRYTAAMSPRKSRAGRTARDSARSVILPAGERRQDEIGAALFRHIGLCPPGTYVRLANGETAVVVRPGAKPTAPLVARVLNRHGEPIAVPSLRETLQDNFSIQSTLAATAVRLRLNLDSMCRMIPA